MVNKLTEISINYKPNINAQKKIFITEPQSAVEQLRTVWNDKLSYQESMYVIFLNNANQVLGYMLLSTGSTTAVLVDIKMILQASLKTNAQGIIVAHNHPSGTLTPSKMDDELTEKLNVACKAIDLKLLDHLIITNEDYYSYKNENNSALWMH